MTATHNETRILALVADGLTNKQIGQATRLSPLTVKSYLRDLSTRWDASNRAHLVMLALRDGVIQ